MKQLFFFAFFISLFMLVHGVGKVASGSDAVNSLRGEIIGELRGNAQAVAVDGEFAYVGFGTALAVVDISDKANPVEVGRLDVGDLVREIAVVQPYAYLATNHGLKIINIANNDMPIPVTTVNRTLMTRVQYRYTDNRLYTLSSDGLDIFSLQNAPDLDLAGQLKSFIATPLTLDLEQNYAFILEGYPSEKLRVIDISRADQLTERTLPVTFRNSRIAVSLPKLLTVDNLCSSQCITYLSVIDFDIDSLKLTFRNEHTVYDSLWSLALEASELYAFVGKDIGLFIYNHHKIDSLGDTLLVKQFDIGDVRDIYVKGDYIFAASADNDILIHPPREGGLYILPAPPMFKTHLPTIRN